MDAYNKFQLEWLISHNHSLPELIEELNKRQFDSPDLSVSDLFKKWEMDSGFGGEIYPCRAEFEECGC